MRAALLLPALVSLQCGLIAGPSAPPSVVTVPLAPEEDERRPSEVPTEPENTVEVDFPWPLEDWAGRGFTPDPEKFAGDFVIEATRGKRRIFVTPVASGAHRVLDVVLAGPGGTTRGIPIEFIPCPPGLAWRKVAFAEPKAAGAGRPSVSLAARVPMAQVREPSPDSELGLIRTLRLMLNAAAGGAADIAAANPALSFNEFGGTPRSFGPFTLSNRFALRDSVTESLGLCVSVANLTRRRLVFDQDSWLVRVGDRVYPVRTVDFPGEVEGGATGTAFLVLARGPGGEPTRLLPDNDFQVSVILGGSVNPRPVVRMRLDGFDSHE